MVASTLAMQHKAGGVYGMVIETEYTYDNLAAALARID
jgi:hypothetical protein